MPIMVLAGKLLWALGFRRRSGRIVFTRFKLYAPIFYPRDIARSHGFNSVYVAHSWLANFRIWLFLLGLCYVLIASNFPYLGKFKFFLHSDTSPTSSA